jgi:hypothetical protein
MSALPTGSKSFQKLNPHLFLPCPTAQHNMDIFVKTFDANTKPPKRLRQSSKPTMNKLESEWVSLLMVEHAQKIVNVQSVTFKLCNGLRYTPDAFAFEWPALGELDRPTAWEVKSCAPLQDDSVAKVKMFAHQYPEIRVILAWRDKNKQWHTQIVLP